jgi:hypothetical protein
MTFEYNILKWHNYREREREREREGGSRLVLSRVKVT